MSESQNKPLDLLLQRNSCGKLCSPGPSAEQLELIFQAALRAPDHAGLKPWQFIVVQGEGRAKLGELFVQAQINAGEAMDDTKKAKTLAMPLRAPVIIAVAASVSEHAKVPDIEQILSAGCAAQNILLAAEALGFGAMWRTGELAFDDLVQDGLGLEQHQMLIGFLYIGTADMAKKSIASQNTADFVRQWP